MKIKEYNYEPIGKRIKKLREQNKYTQEQLAEKINKGSQHISEIERGLSGLSISSLMDICKIFNVDSDYILFGKINEGNNPFNKLLEQLNPQQTLYAENILEIYVKSCIDK